MSTTDKLQTIADNTPKVYKAGQKSEYDRFWDAYQDSGNRTNYNNAFGGNGWTLDTFQPKYDMKPLASYMLFRNSAINVDLVAYLDSLGVVLDLSRSGTYQYIFQSTLFTRVGEIDGTRSGATGYIDVFNGSNLLETIDKLTVKSTQTFGSNCFNGCTALKNITFGGTIGKNLNIKWSTLLTKNSIMSIINALSTTTTGTTLTLSGTAVDNAFESSEGAADGSSSTEWTTLVAAHSNWTISLV